MIFKEISESFMNFFRLQVSQLALFTWRVAFQQRVQQRVFSLTETRITEGKNLQKENLEKIH